MPPPTRPFTTSSLTSTLRSTIASQPLLSNLTSIDKLSSQASSLAQKAPFFNNIANNISNNINNNSGSSSSIASSNNRSNIQQHLPLQHDANFGQHHQQSSQAANMIRNQAGPSGAASTGGQASNQPRPPMASTPTVDMSHLTEEERLMIQSVMAKAEMADMGMPVDTSAPSSTNLPSNTSQVLSQQTKQNLQHQQQNMQHHQQQQHQELQHLQQISQQNMSQQQQPQINQDHIGGSRQLNLMQVSSSGNMNDPNMMQVNNNLGNQQMNQLQSFTQQQQHQNQQSAQPYAQQLDQQQSNTMMLNNSTVMNNQPMMDSKSSLALLQQQTQQTVANINAQFNLNQPQEMQQKSNTLDTQGFSQPALNRQRDMNNQQASQNIANQQQLILLNNLQQVNQQNSFDQSMQLMQQNQRNMNQNNIDPISQQLLNPSYPPNQIQSGSMIYDQTKLMQVSPTQPYFGPRDGDSINMIQNQLPNQTQQYPTTSAQNNYNEFGQTHMIPQGLTNPSMLTTQQVVGNEMSNATSYNNQIMTERPNLQYQTSLNNQFRPLNESNVRNDLPQQHNQSFPQEPYNNSRNEIRFGLKMNLSDDQTFSDQECHRSDSRKHNVSKSISKLDGSIEQNEELHPRYMRSTDNRSKKLADERALQAYDLANRNPSFSLRPAKTRQLPQPNQPDSRSSNERIHDERVDRRCREDKRSVKNKSKDTKQDSPKYLSYSDEDEEESRRQNGKDINLQSRKSPGSTKDTIDKSEEALRLISELKLTEQANQVMEQQQLLIKQSQELIKLQLEQQALSQELKKSIKHADLKAKDNNGDMKEKKAKKSECSEIDEDWDVQPNEEDRDFLSGDRNSRQKTEESSKLTMCEDKFNKRDKLVQSKKSTSICEDVDSDIDDSIRSSNRPNSKSKEAKLDQCIGSDFDRRSKFSDRSINDKQVQANVSSSASQTDPCQRYNRELLHSPTDTTDSDIDTISQSNLRRQHRLNQTRPKGVIRRREPTGLPPSPLPVSAAIQLHQMQQQHYKQMGSKSNARANFTSARSRSVTSSPGHHLDHLSGYLTDNQRIRSTSPDTWSEFGGQRRRKRLPEPPTNLVPLTPSMVRKMIQSQRAGASSSRLLTSVNAQSTLMTNTHTNRNVAFEKPSGRSSPGILQSGTSLSKHTPPQKNLASDNEVQRPRTVLEGSSDLNKFLSSTYGNSILKNNISEVKETPELDKIISNLDDYYGLDNKRQSRIQRSQDHGLSNQSSRLINQPGLSSSLAATSTRPTWHNSRLNHSNPPSLVRCNSEGEENLAARLARQSYRQPYMSDHLGESRALTSSYLNKSTFSSTTNSQSPSNRLHTPLISSIERTQETCPGINDLSARTSSPSRYDWTSRNYKSPNSNTHMFTRTNILPTSTGVRDILDYSSQQTQFSEHRPYSAALTDYTNIGSTYSRNLVNSPVTDSLSSRYRYLSTREHNRVCDQGDQNADGIRYHDSTTSVHQRTFVPQHHTLDHQRSLDYDLRQTYYPGQRTRSILESRAIGSTYNQVRPTQLTDDSITNSTYLGYQGYNSPSQMNYVESFSGNETSRALAPLTKDDIINNVPKFDSIGYRFRTENQNKYVAHAITPVRSYQTRYPPPYKRISLSKNPKDRIGNGIGMKITGGQSIPSLYDKVNRCIVTAGAFVTEVFQNSNVYFMDEIHEGDQIIEWNGVNLCNRSDEEIQQILLSQLSDDEVEIVYLPIDKFYTAYGVLDREFLDNQNINQQNKNGEQDTFDTFSRINRSGHGAATDITRNRFSDINKGSIRRKLSLSSIAHMWSK